jgi:hypothetical protein
MAKSFPKKIKKILAETKGQLSSLYAQRLKEVILFGSYALSVANDMSGL